MFDKNQVNFLFSINFLTFPPPKYVTIGFHSILKVFSCLFSGEPRVEGFSVIWLTVCKRSEKFYEGNVVCIVDRLPSPQVFNCVVKL